MKSFSIALIMVFAVSADPALSQSYKIQKTIQKPEKCSVPLFHKHDLINPMGWFADTKLYEGSGNNLSVDMLFEKSCRIIFSGSKGYFGLLTISGKVSDIYKFSLPIYNIEGASFRLDSYGGHATLYDTNGNLFKKVMLSDKEDFNIEKTANAKFSGSGECVLISAMLSSAD